MKTQVNANPSSIQLDADIIKIKDAAGKIAATDVEGALSENRGVTNDHINSLTAHQDKKIVNTSNMVGANQFEVNNNIKALIEAFTVAGTDTDPRLTQALLDTEGKTWTNFADMLIYWESIVVDLMDKLSKEQSKPITVTDITTVDDAYGGPVDWSVKGATLNQAALNGNFANGTIGWTPIGITDFTVDPNVAKFTSTSTNGRISQTNKITSNRKYLVKARVKADSSNVQLSLSNLTNYGVAKNHSGSNKFEDLYFIADFTERDGNTNGQIRILDSRTSGWTEIQIDKKIGIHYVDITDTFMENWTADQIFSSINSYWEGFGGTENPVVETHGVNHFDIDNVPIDGTYVDVVDKGPNYVRLKGTYYTRIPVKLKKNTNYKMNWETQFISGTMYEKYRFEYEDGTLSNAVIKNWILATHSTLKVVAVYVYIASSTLSEVIYSNIRLIESNQTDLYTPYNPSIVSISGELFGLPNNIADEAKSENGKKAFVFRTNGGRDQIPYAFKDTDILAYQTMFTNLDYVAIANPVDYIGKGKTSINDCLLSNGLVTTYSSNVDDINNIGKLLTNVNLNEFYMGVSKGTYLNLANVRTDLIANKKLNAIYQLSNPTIVEEQDFNNYGVSITDDLGTVSNESNTFIVSAQNFNPVVDIKYDLNIFTAFDSVKDVLKETRSLVTYLLTIQDEQDAMLLDHSNRISVLEGV